MLGRSGIITTAVLLAGCAVTATAAGHQDLPSPHARDDARPGNSVGIDGAGHPLSNYHPLGVSPGARDQRPTRATAPIVVRVSSGFDWRDAAFGAAGMLALLSIIAGSTLLVVSGRRRRASAVLTR
jgi:hypothetical protein